MARPLKQTVEYFFRDMTFEVNVEASFLDERQTLLINIDTIDPQVLIGTRGQTLKDISHVLKIILRKKIILDYPFFIEIDINEYRKKKAEYLKELAISTADEVSLSQKEKAFPPMPADERRIIHLELAKREDIVTESEGEGEDRKVIVKPR